MKAFLLAAGLGTRLRPFTNEIPKCLLPIDGRPLIQIWIEHLGEHGIDEVLINTHWLHEKVEEFFESRKYAVGHSKIGKAFHGLNSMQVIESSYNVRPKIRLFYEPELLGSAGTLLANRDWVADGKPFFILYGDNLTDVNLTKIYTFHCQHGLPFTLGVFKTNRPRQCGIAEVGENGLVKGFVEKPENPKSDLAAAGVYMADHRIFDLLPQLASSPYPLDLGFHVIPKLVGKMRAYCIEEFLMDIGTPESYEEARSAWSRAQDA